MEFIETTGKTVDDAITDALVKLGVTSLNMKFSKRQKVDF